MTWTLFEVTPERAKEIRRQIGFATADERERQAREQAADREPLPYVETPEDLKREREEALRRRLAAVDFYGKALK